MFIFYFVIFGGFFAIKFVHFFVTDKSEEKVKKKQQEKLSETDDGRNFGKGIY